MHKFYFDYYTIRGSTYMYFINTNFTLTKAVGSLSSSRIEMLKAYFSPIFPEILQPNEQTLIFKHGVSAFIISSDQIVFATQGDKSDINLHEISKYLFQANEILGLSDKSSLTIRLEAIEDSPVDTLEKSKSLVGDFTDNLNPRGIGYRFMIDNESFQGDVHVEPFIKDPQKIYFNVILGTHDQVPLQNAEQVLGDMYSFGTENSIDAAKKLFSL